MHHQESHSPESRLPWLHICSCSGGPFSNFYRSRLHLLRWGSKLPGIQAHPKVLAGCGWITPSPPSPWQQQTLICMYFQGGGEADARPSSVENAGWKLVNSIIQKIINSKVLEIDSDGGDLGAAERIAAVFSHKYWYRRFIWQAITLHIRRMADVEVISFVAVKACSAAYYIAAATDYIMVSRWVSYIQKSHSVCLCVFVCVCLFVCFYRSAVIGSIGCISEVPQPDDGVMVVTSGPPPSSKWLLLLLAIFPRWEEAGHLAGREKPGWRHQCQLSQICKIQLSKLLSKCFFRWGVDGSWRITRRPCPELPSMGFRSLPYFSIVFVLNIICICVYRVTQKNVS